MGATRAARITAHPLRMLRTRAGSHFRPAAPRAWMRAAPSSSGPTSTAAPWNHDHAITSRPIAHHRGHRSAYVTRITSTPIHGRITRDSDCGRSCTNATITTAAGSDTSATDLSIGSEARVRTTAVVASSSETMTRAAIATRNSSSPGHDPIAWIAKSSSSAPAWVVAHEASAGPYVHAGSPVSRPLARMSAPMRMCQ